jgi:acetylornithine deacetylase/succinyl-diaminopimelate desuccinylase-like protein
VLDFLVDFLSEYLPNMKVEKQYLNGSKRYNIVMKGNNKPKLFALGHTDTVQPNDEWLTNPIQPIIKEDILFGLGSADMKSS